MNLKDKKVAPNDVCQHATAALTSGIFWLQFCAVGGSGDTASVFIYVNAKNLQDSNRITEASGFSSCTWNDF